MSTVASALRIVTGGQWAAMITTLDGDDGAVTRSGPEKESNSGHHRVQHPRMNDDETERILLAGDPVALAKLVRDLMAYAKTKVPVHAAEEIADEALVKAVRSWKLAGATGSLRRLVMAAATSLSIDWHRQRARRGDSGPLSEA